MRSPNSTVFLLVGFYLSLFLFQADGAIALGGHTTYVLACIAFLPGALVCRKRTLTAAALVVMPCLFGLMLSLMAQSPFSLAGLEGLIAQRPLPVYVFLLVLLPGMFCVSELDPERLPYELSYWSGLRLFRPLVSVFAGRERLLRRLAAIRETCEARGIMLTSRYQHLRSFHIWLVPLVTATVQEAAYAHRVRERLGCSHRFIPTRPPKPHLTVAQKLCFALLLAIAIIGAHRNVRLWIST